MRGVARSFFAFILASGTAACRDGGGDDPTPEPRPDAGVEPDAGPVEVPLRRVVDAGPAAPVSFEAEATPLLPHASLGSRCVGGERRWYAVLSERPADCAAHARALVAGEAETGTVLLALPEGAGEAPVDFEVDATVCADDGCRPRTLAIELPAFEPGAAVRGRFALDGGDGTDTGSITPVWCDYDAIVPPPEGDTPVRGLRIGEVSINQGVRTRLGPDGPELDEGLEFDPVVVAGRPGLLRVTVEPVEDTWVPREVIARLDLGEGDVRETRFTPSGPSDLGDRATTIEFALGPEDVAEATRWAVSLWEVAACAETVGPQDGAAFPTDGALAPLRAQDAGGALDVVIVPMRFTADGSDRLPDTSAAALARYADEMRRVYPVAEVNVRFREPVDLEASVTRSANWSAFLYECIDLRTADAPPEDTYYYCIANPAESFSSYCTGGCVLGLGTLPADDDQRLRASVGVGYLGRAESTFVHEVGHNHGRRHTPCGNPAGVDPEYPRDGARIGGWGWDVVDDVLVDPARARDFMSYCGPEWVSDYTFAALFERHRKIETAIAPAVVGPLRPWRTAIVEANGPVRWAGWTGPTIDAGGDPVAATWVGPGGDRRPVAASFAAFDHLDGGFLSVEDPGVPEGVGHLEALGIGSLPW